MLHKDEILGPGSGHEMYCKKCGYNGNSYYHMTCPRKTWEPRQTLSDTIETPITEDTLTREEIWLVLQEAGQIAPYGSIKQRDHEDKAIANKAGEKVYNMSQAEIKQLKKALEILSTHVANLFETDACPGDDVTIKSCDTYMNCSNCLKDWALRQAKDDASK